MSDEGLKELERLRPLIKDVFLAPEKPGPPLSGELDVQIFRLLGRIIPLFRFEPPDLIGSVVMELLGLYFAGLPPGGRQRIVEDFLAHLPGDIEMKERLFFGDD